MVLASKGSNLFPFSERVFFVQNLPLKWQKNSVSSSIVIFKCYVGIANSAQPRALDRREYLVIILDNFC